HYSKIGIERVKEKLTWKTAAGDYVDLFERMIKRGLNNKNDFSIPKYFFNPKQELDRELRKELRRLYFS
ncbi:MAG: hypothetical protein ACOC5T_07655, partial [Elusimicrobiota bacterium]